MKLRLLLPTLTLLILSSFNSMAQTPAYGVSPFDSDFVVMDTAMMTVTSTTGMTSNAGAVTGANGLAADPCGVLYILYKTSAGRHLGIIDPATASITDIGLFADNLANIAFVNGVLLGVTGDGASVSETLYSIDITTAAMTLITALGNGNDGESIAFNPDDGLLYHWSGWGATNLIMETINPVTFAISPIAPSGATLNNVGASTYAGNGQFLVGDVFDGDVKYVSTTGVVTTTPNTTNTFKGLEFAGPSADITVTPSDSICAGDTAVLLCTNVGVTYEWFLDGVTTSNTTNTLDATVTGAYVCEIDDGVCVIASDTINLTVSNLPTTNITPSPTASICAGDSIELAINTGGGPVQVQWYMDGAMIAGATGTTYFANASGSYNATKTNQNGCTDSSAIATVLTVNPLPNVSITPSPTASICLGDSIELIPNGAGGGTFQWSLNGTAIAGATGSTYFASAAGSYNVTKTNMNGCSDSSSVGTVINVNPLPPVSLTPGPTVNFCSGDNVSITIAQGGGGGTYQWYLNGAIIPGATTNTYVATAEGSYNLIKTNSNGCSDSSAVATTLIDTCSNNLLELHGLSFDVYPNPASDFVQIDFNSSTQSDLIDIKLVGLDGKVIRVARIEGTNGMTLNVSDIKSGVYFIQLNTTYGRIVKEVIIE